MYFVFYVPHRFSSSLSSMPLVDTDDTRDLKWFWVGIMWACTTPIDKLIGIQWNLGQVDKLRFWVRAFVWRKMAGPVVARFVEWLEDTWSSNLKSTRNYLNLVLTLTHRSWEQPITLHIVWSFLRVYFT